jgi:hypothetical protein
MWRLRGSYLLLGLSALALSASALPQASQAAEPKIWVDVFDEKDSDLANSGRNAFFVLESGFKLELGTSDGGKKHHLLITVLNETKNVAGVETRVVEERETQNGQLEEISRNFFACSRKTKNIYYFGEEVDTYTKGKVTGHEGSWLAGEHGARYGLAMPAEPKVGYRFYQEVAPKVAMDRAEIVEAEATLDTPAGRLEHLLKVEESTPLEPKSKEVKHYAPGIGLVQDEDMKLLSKPK